MMHPGFIVIENEPLPSVFTGIFDSTGKPVYRMSVEKPPIGFISHPDDMELFNCDPDQDTFYTTEI